MSKAAKQATLLNAKTTRNGKDADDSSIKANAFKQRQVHHRLLPTTDYKRYKSPDKENAHVLSDYKLARRKLPGQQTIHEKLKSNERPLRKDVSGKGASQEDNHTTAKPAIKSSKPDTGTVTNTRTSTAGKSRGSTAAMILGKSADGLASSPRKAGRPGASPDSRQSNVARPVRQLDFKPNVSSENQKSSRKITNSAKQAENRQGLFKVTTAKAVVSTASPSLSKIPSDMVRQMVNSIQSTSATIGNGLGTPIRQNRKSAFYTNATMANGYCRKSLAPGADMNDVVAEDFGVTVAVRIRPLSQREIDLNAQVCVKVNGNEILAIDSTGSTHSFVYDYSFWSVDKIDGDFACQRVVYNKLAQPLLEASLDGYNTCLFAYGQTGSGKSYTIMGLGEDIGIVPRFSNDLFSVLHARTTQTVKHRIEVSYFEIYNEKIHDLLVSSVTTEDGETSKQVLRVREHPEQGPYVEGLSRFSVKTFSDVQSWLEVGNRQRATAATGMNDKSSRSHSVFTITLIQTETEELEGETHESSKMSRINLVDLAGSERSSTAATTGQRFKEGASINKSLLTLGKVICALSERSAMSAKRRKRLFVPYRDSTLTWILKESLGGNSRTAMIATVSPADCHLEETLSTLRYAKQASNIVNLVKVNEDPNAKLIRELKAEVAKLKEAYTHPEIDPEKFKASLQEVTSLREQLGTAELEKHKVEQQWRRRLEESEKHKSDEINELKRAGVSFKVDNQLPNLVNLNEDPQLSELLLYMIKQGDTRVGKKGSDCDIQLNGALVADYHCEITNKNEVVKLTPVPDAAVFVNGDLITNKVVLHHGDRIVIGGDHFFRFNNPIEVQRCHGNKRSSKEGPKDFEFAKHELIERQNARMAAEIEAAQLKVKQEMLQEIDAAKLEAKNQITKQRNEYETAIESLQSQIRLDQKTKRELETIREEKEVLEKEVNINRRNRAMEAKILNEKQNTYQSEQIRAQVLADLEAEREKLAREVERMQKKAALLNVPQPSNHVVSPLRISLLLKEASNISKKLNRHTVFTQHDSDSNSCFIRVHNTKLGIWTLWDLSKFEEKLEQMREVYDSGSKDDLDNLFYDPTDEWQETFNQQRDVTNDTPTSGKSNSRRLTRRLSSLVLARASPALQDSLMKLNQENAGSVAKQPTLDPTVVTSLCKKRINACLQNMDLGFESEMDKLLLALEEISSLSQSLLANYEENDGFLESSAFHENSIGLTLQTEMILFAAGSVAHHCADVAASSHSVTKLLRQVDKAFKKLASHVTKILHGCHSDIQSLVLESSSKLRHLTPNISKYLGALSIATNMEVTLFNEENQHKLSHRLKHAFLQGGDTLMRKILSGGVDQLKNISRDKEADESECSVAEVTFAVEKLLQTCIDLQEELQARRVQELLNERIRLSLNASSESSLLLHGEDMPAHYYDECFSRTRSLVHEVGHLVDGVTRINAEVDASKQSAPSSALRYSTESLWGPVARIADLCQKHEDLCSAVQEFQRDRGSDSSANSNENNNVFTTESETTLHSRANAAVLSAAQEVHRLLRDLIDVIEERNSSASSECENPGRSDERSFRRKRLLPTSPLVLESHEVCSSSFAIKDAVSKWLQLADSFSHATTDRPITTDSVYV